MFKLPRRPVEEAEIIDNFSTPYRVAEKNYAFMEEVNSFYGGRRVITSFLSSELQTNRLRGKDSFSILDLGAGSCDIPAAVIKWGRQREIAVNYTCLEKHPAAVRRAREKNRLDKLQLVDGDILDYEPERRYDYVTISLVLHHFCFSDIQQIIAKYSNFTREAIIVNDLFRHPVLYFLTWLRTRITTQENRHDALLSVKKGFTPEELKTLTAGLPGLSVRVERLPLFRLQAIFRPERSSP